MEEFSSLFDTSLYGNCNDVIVSSSAELDLWKTSCGLLPTPPRSPDSREAGLVPEYGQLFDGAADLYSDAIGNTDVTGFDSIVSISIKDIIQRLSADEKVLSDCIDETLASLKECESTIDNVLLRDFMWSAPGLEAIGFGGPRGPSFEADPLLGACPPATCNPSGITPSPFINPTQVFEGQVYTSSSGNVTNCDESDASSTGLRN